MSHPRVLHLGFHPIGAPTNSGITLGTMFGRWPEDRLLQVCLRTHPDLPTPANAVVAPTRVAPLDALARRALGRRVPAGAVDGLNNSIERTGRAPIQVRARLIATALNDVGPVRLPPALVARVARFRPQVVHSLLGGVRAMRLALAFAERFDLPIVPHFMDDWPDNLFRQGQLWGYARRVAQRDLDRVLARAPVCLTIGTDMEREFEARFGRPCPVVGNSVDLTAYDRLPPTARALPASGDIVLRYVGGLHLGRDQVVGSIAAALAGRRIRGGRAWRLELFVPSGDSERARTLEQEHEGVRHRGSIAPTQVPETLVGAHALLFLESDVPSIARFTRLSVSTKVPDYLASGRPILVLGPADQGSVRTIRRSRTGVYSADMVAATLDRAVAELERQVLVDGAGATAREPWLAEEFGTEATHRRLEACLASAARSVAGFRR